MQFNDTTTKNGLCQEFEFWTGQNDGDVSGDTALLKQFANRVNRAYDKVLPYVFSSTDVMRFDDSNHTDFPIATFDIVENQSDYTFTEDENGNSVLNIIEAHILPDADATQYIPLSRVLLNTREGSDILMQNSLQTGSPSRFVETNSTIFLDCFPNYAKADGLKLIFERSPAYFAYDDTTKTPGIPEPFHPLLALYAALDWLIVNKPESQVLISRLETRIAEAVQEFERWADKRNPADIRLFMQAPEYL